MSHTHRSLSSEEIIRRAICDSEKIYLVHTDTGDDDVITAKSESEAWGFLEDWQAQDGPGYPVPDSWELEEISIEEYVENYRQ